MQYLGEFANELTKNMRFFVAGSGREALFGLGSGVSSFVEFQIAGLLGSGVQEAVNDLCSFDLSTFNPHAFV